MLNRAGSYDDAFLSCTFKYVLSKRFFFLFFFSHLAAMRVHFRTKKKQKKVLDNNLQNEVLKNQRKRSRKNMVSIIL